MQAIYLGEQKSLIPPAERRDCKICHGTGVDPKTETEDSYGDPCDNDCPFDREALERLRAS